MGGWARLTAQVLRLAEKLAAAWQRNRNRREVERRRRQIKEQRHAIDRDPASAGRRLFGGGMRRDGGDGEGR